MRGGDPNGMKASGMGGVLVLVTRVSERQIASLEKEPLHFHGRRGGGASGS
jgi:hypothetical protein